MKIDRSIILFKTASFTILCILTTLYSCKQVKSGMLIATEAKLNIQIPGHATGECSRYLPGARIIAFHPGKPGSVKILTGDFQSAAFPEVSYRGSHILFTAQHKSDDPWQIWEMDLKNLKYRKITSFKENCTDPAYLPGGRMVFSKLTVNDTVKSAHCLYTCKLDGSDLRQITFSPDDNFTTTVLKDGRLLTVTRQLIPVQGDPMLMVLRPDGTKADMFYMNKQDTIIVSNPRENNDGRIAFIESAGGSSIAGRLVSISYKRPLHTRINLTTGIDGELCSAYPLGPEKYLVSARISGSKHFILYEFDPEEKHIGELIFSDPEYDILDVILAEEYERPIKLPSEVDMAVKTGLLLCQDINFPDPLVQTKYSNVIKASKIEALGVDTTYGVVDVEEDGSFYLKVMADTPFRIRTLDEKGNIVNGPCSWLWLRPNERRGCVGCHEDPEIVPENRIPLAVKKSPLIIPVHISAIKEKTVELE